MLVKVLRLSLHVDLGNKATDSFDSNMILLHLHKSSQIKVLKQTVCTPGSNQCHSFACLATEGQTGLLHPGHPSTYATVPLSG